MTSVSGWLSARPPGQAGPVKQKETEGPAVARHSNEMCRGMQYEYDWDRNVFTFDWILFSALLGFTRNYTVGCRIMTKIPHG